MEHACVYLFVIERYLPFRKVAWTSGLNSYWVGEIVVPVDYRVLLNLPWQEEVF